MWKKVSSPYWRQSWNKMRTLKSNQKQAYKFRSKVYKSSESTPSAENSTRSIKTPQLIYWFMEVKSWNLPVGESPMRCCFIYGKRILTSSSGSPRRKPPTSPGSTSRPSPTSRRSLNTRSWRTARSFYLFCTTLTTLIRSSLRNWCCSSLGKRRKASGGKGFSILLSRRRRRKVNSSAFFTFLIYV